MEFLSAHQSQGPFMAVCGHWISHYGYGQDPGLSKPIVARM